MKNLNLIHKVGIFNDLEKEFIVTDPRQKKVQDNYLFNDNYFSYVTHTGMGYSKYTDCDDFTTDIVGDQQYIHSRIIYIKNNDTDEYWSVGWDPIRKDYEKYECRLGMNYTIITNVTDGVECIWCILVPKGKDAVELWDVALKSRKKMNLSIYFYTELSLVTTYNTYGHVVYLHAAYNKDTNTITAVQKSQQLKTKLNSISSLVSRKPDAYTCSREDFLGLYGTAANPEALSSKSLPNTPASKENYCAAYQFDIKLEAEETVKLNNIVVGHNDEDDIEKIREKYFNFSQVFEETKKSIAHSFSSVEISTGNKSLDRITNIWNKQQILYGSIHCRWGIKGYRDLAQHSMGVVYFDPKLSKNNFIKLLKYQYSNGFSVRSFPLVYEDSKMHYSDSALWLIYGITEYLKETGDFDFLNEKIPFLDDGDASVIEHMDLMIKASFADLGEHNLVKIHGGDWNDSFTHVGKNGRGESVWLSMFLAKAILLMKELKIFLNHPGEKYDKMYNTLKQALNTHAWDGEWYIMAYNDLGEKIGSKENKEGSIYLNSQSWSIISGVANSDKIELMKKSIDKYLNTDYGYTLNFPHYSHLNKNIGRMSVLEPGTCENGTVYTHGNAFMIYALLSIGDAEHAYKLYNKINPENPILASNSICPYVYGNGYFGPSNRKEPGKMEISWITGSSDWLIQSIVEQMIGIRRTYNGIVINPVLPKALKDVTVFRRFRGTEYNITIENRGPSIKSMECNGRVIDKALPLPMYNSTEQSDIIKVIME